MKPSAIILFISLFFFPACTLIRNPTDSQLNYVKTSFNEKVFKMGGQSAVIIGAKNNLVSNDIKKFVARFTIKSDKNEEYFVSFNDNKAYQNKKDGYADYVIMLLPGKYQLVGYELYGDYSIGYQTLSTYGNYSFSFEVKPDELVYLGCIVTETVNIETQNKKWYQQKYTNQIAYDTKIEDFSIASADLFSAYEAITGKKTEVRLIDFVDKKKVKNAEQGATPNENK